eukprot:gene5368-3863_t
MQGKIARVELLNFKSYGGSVTVGPFQDFTCIVGPNGAGKSNLMDAVTMALSTRDSSIRGVPLKEFINRQSNATECAVTVVLHHSPPSTSQSRRGGSQTVETAFTRRVNKDDHSFYAINGKTVTEAEYFDALAQHNISGRVRNFIVFQHEVEAVTQKTPVQLTALLEEVSGSLELKPEYDTKKKALENANELLSKASVERRGATIEANQMRLVKKDAERFNELQKQLKEEQWNGVMAELFYVESVLVQQKKELAKFHETLDKLQQSVPSESHIREMKQQFISQHKAYSKEQETSQAAADELRNKQSLVERAKASIEHMQRQQTAQKRVLENLGKEIATRSTEMNRFQQQKERYEALLREFDAETERDRSSAAKAAGTLNEADMEEFRCLQSEAECQTVTKRQQRETLERQLEAAKATLQQCKSALEHTQLRQKEIRDTINRLRAHQTELEQRKKELINGVKSLEKQIKASQKAQLEAKKRHSEREADLLKVQEQLRELRDVKDNDKQNARNSDIMATLKSLFGVKGRVVDVCTIPNNAYRNALTVALGKNLDAMIVDTTETAIRCVAYLKEQRVPSRTFLPLDAVTGKQVTDRLRTFGGTCKPLVDVLRYDPEIEPVIRYALGETLVCDTLAEAKKVAYGRGDSERFKVVTVDGTVLMKNGTVQGGLASIENRARKWDDRRYEELRATRDRLLNEAVRGGEAEMARAQIELRDMASRLDFSRERLKVVDAELATNATRLETAAHDEKKINDEVAQLHERVNQHEADVAKRTRDIEAVNESMEKVEATVFADLQKRVDIRGLLEAERRLKNLAQERGQRRQQLVVIVHKLETAIEAEQQRIGEKALQEARAAFERKEDEILRAQKNLTALEQENATLRQRSVDAKRRLVALREGLDRLQVSIRTAAQTSEAELRRLALARKGGAGLEAACNGLRQRRINIIRRAEMDGIALPIKPSSGAGSKRRRGDESKAGSSSSLPLAHSETFTLNTEAVSAASASTLSSEASEAPGTSFIDFSSLPDSLKEAASSRERLAALQTRLQASCEKITMEMEALGPQLKAAARLGSSAGRLDQLAARFQAALEEVRRATAEFQDVRKRRTARFMEVYEKMASNVDRIYKELTVGTRSRGAPGSAYLSLEDTEEPYLGGTVYHATPPMKRFMPMELLSGGERTMAALALLFAIHALSPSPFFVLDEVDAALDAGNVEKLARYVRQNAQQGQFVVVSHKDQLYCLADVLLGVTTKQKDVPQVLSLDLRGYSF